MPSAKRPASCASHRPAGYEHARTTRRDSAVPADWRGSGRDCSASDSASSTAATALLVTVNLMVLASDALQQHAIVEVAGKAIDQARVDGEPRLDARQRSPAARGSVASGAPRLDGTRVLRGTRSASRARRARPRHRSPRRRSHWDRAWVKSGTGPFLRLADVDLMVERKQPRPRTSRHGCRWRAARDDPRSPRCACPAIRPEPETGRPARPARRSLPIPHTISGSARRSNRSCGR